MLAALGLFVQSSFHLPDDVFSNPKGIDALFQVRFMGETRNREDMSVAQDKCCAAAWGVEAFTPPPILDSTPPPTLSNKQTTNQVSAERPQAIAQILIAIGAIEVAGLVASDGKGPGDYGFDPLGLKPKTDEALEELQLKEIKNGRLAMVSVVRCGGGGGMLDCWGWGRGVD